MRRVPRAERCRAVRRLRPRAALHTSLPALALRHHLWIRKRRHVDHREIEHWSPGLPGRRHPCALRWYPTLGPHAETSVGEVVNWVAAAFASVGALLPRVRSGHRHSRRAAQVDEWGVG